MGIALFLTVCVDQERFFLLLLVKHVNAHHDNVDHFDDKRKGS